MPFVSKKRSLRELAVDVVFAPWRVEGAVALPGIVILFLVALAIVFFLFYGRGERLDGVVVGVLIGLTLFMAFVVMGGLSVALAVGQWRATGGRSWSYVADPACQAAAEKFARLYLAGEEGEAYALLDPAVRDKVSLESFECRRRDFPRSRVVEQVSVSIEEPDDWSPGDADGRLRRFVREGRPVACFDVELAWAVDGERSFVCFDVNLSGRGKAWFVTDWEPLSERAR